MRHIFKITCNENFTNGEIYIKHLIQNPLLISANIVLQTVKH